MFIESSSESAQSMIDSVSPKDDEKPKAREVKPLKPIVDDVDEDEPSSVSKAASELGKEGAKAKAAKRAEAEKDAKKAASVEEVDEEDDHEPAKGKPGDLREQIKEKARALAEHKRELAAERSERQKLAARLAELEAPKREPVKAEPAKAEPIKSEGAPKQSDYEDYGDFVIAAAKWAAEDTHKARDKDRSERERTAKIDKDIHEWKSGFSTRIQERVKAEPDFLSKLSEDVRALKPIYNAIRDNEPVTALNYVADRLISSKQAPELALYLSTHDGELERLAALRTTEDVLYEMAKIEARLDSPSAAASTGSSIPSGSSKAKPPVKPVTGSPNIGSDDDLSDDAPLSAHVRRFGRMLQANR